MPPTLANRKICYIEMPATDMARSAGFYKRVFGWVIRKRGDGSTRAPARRKAGLLFYIMVDSVASTVDMVVTHGGARSCSRSARMGPRYGEVPRSGRKRDRPLPATRLTLESDRFLSG